jgi:hypothetical protein
MRIVDNAREDVAACEKELDFWKTESRKLEKDLMEAMHEFHVQLTRTIQLYPNDVATFMNATILTKKLSVRLPPIRLSVTEEMTAYEKMANEELRAARLRVTEEWEKPINNLIYGIARLNRPRRHKSELKEMRLISLYKWLIDLWPRVLK